MKIKNLSLCIIGLCSSVILTIIPFHTEKIIQRSKLEATFIILLCAVIQIVIHFKCFFHMELEKEKKWQITSTLFSILIILTILSASHWIIYNLEKNALH